MTPADWAGRTNLWAGGRVANGTQTMIGKQYTDERAVSPVIGVILMVAITVILAAVIGTFVLDLGQNAGQSAPQASLDISLDTSVDNVTIDHTGGDDLLSDRTKITVTNQSTDNTATYESSNGDALSVGDSADIGVTGTVGVEGWGSGWTSSSSISGITSGHTYTIQVIDTKTSKIIYETDITA